MCTMPAGDPRGAARTKIHPISRGYLAQRLQSIRHVAREQHGRRVAIRVKEVVFGDGLVREATSLSRAHIDRVKPGAQVISPGVDEERSIIQPGWTTIDHPSLGRDDVRGRMPFDIDWFSR